MKKLFAFAAGLVLALALVPAMPALAATDATGTWTTTVQGPNGDMTLTFHFKQDGGALTGTVESSMGGDPFTISNGKIDGDKITFDTSFNGMTINHTGTVGEDEIKLSAKSEDGQMPPMDLTLKRAK
ncbi:hypothetical protein DYQ86_14880 [Acidobacteria bacterium AB60]|nr:hypothetical protein DYQ86_14880 [Acidobacteria bacterium AB60]